MQTPESQEMTDKIEQLMKLREQSGLNYIMAFDPLHENRHARRMKAKRKVKQSKYESNLTKADRARRKATQKRSRPVKLPKSCRAAAKGTRKSPSKTR